MSLRVGVQMDPHSTLQLDCCFFFFLTRAYEKMVEEITALTPK